MAPALEEFISKERRGDFAMEVSFSAFGSDQPPLQEPPRVTIDKFFAPTQQSCTVIAEQIRLLADISFLGQFGSN